MFQLSYINYLVLLFIISGILLLLLDTKTYSQENATREAKASRVLGWGNISLGVLAYAGNWLMEQLMF